MESKEVYQLTKKVLFALFVYLFIQLEAIGQSTNNLNDSTVVKKEVKMNAEELLDTDETLLYVGEKMMYQLKKKLHLSDEEDEAEEKKRKEKAKNVKFSLFGITIEK